MRGGGCAGGAGGAVGAGYAGFADPAAEQVLHGRSFGGDGRVGVVQGVGVRDPLGLRQDGPAGTFSGHGLLLPGHGGLLPVVVVTTRAVGLGL